MSERIGVFVCDCGTNISDALDTGALSEFAGKFADVVEIRVHRLWCSEEGREELKQAIRDKGLTRVVMAACSPKQHELTFQKVLAAAGLNPCLLQMANIREQIAWVTSDRTQATEKAKCQLNSALRRVMLQQPLERIEMECKNDFLVIGSGVAGMSAALTLAQKNRKVYLVEKDPWIGGKVVACEDVFPTLECAPCMLEPTMDQVLHHERIVLLTNSEIGNVKGFFGNFEVRLDSKARFVDIEKCIGCGACYDACPVTVKNEHQGGLADRKAIFTAFTGRLPNAPVIDRENCLRFKGESCTRCRESCPFGAIDYEQADTQVTAEVGAIVVATGFDLFDTSAMENFNCGSPDVINTFQLERMIASTGPTEGKIVTASGVPPESVAFIHCVGSRDKNYKEYCSGICCANNLKLAHLVRKKLGDVKVFDIYSDWCLPHKGYQEFFNKMSDEGTAYIRVRNPNEVVITQAAKGLLVDYGTGSQNVDMVVLAPAMVPAKGAAGLAARLGLTLDKNGFYSAEHERLAPAATAARGIYIAGCGTGPRDIPQTVMQAQAAAGMALSVIVPGEKLELEVSTSCVNEKLCGGCRVCVPMCPYQAISFDPVKRTAVVNEILCKGCGVCVAACPSGAVTNKHFTLEQIFSEIEGVLL